MFTSVYISGSGDQSAGISHNPIRRGITMKANNSGETNVSRRGFMRRGGIVGVTLLAGSGVGVGSVTAEQGARAGWEPNPTWRN